MKILRGGNLAGLLKKLPYLLPFALLLSMPLSAQTVLGTWQATLPNQEDPRIVLQLRQLGNDSLAGSLTFIDHDNVAAPLASVMFASSELKFAVGDISYTGRALLPQV